MKVAWEGSRLSEYPDILKVKIPDKLCDRLIFGDVGTVGAGGNSGFQAINLAVQFGARRIVLIGFDMRDDGRFHWYGRNHWPMAGNPSVENYARWIAAMQTAAAQLAERGIDTVNVSPTTAVEDFRRASLADIVKEWS